MISIVDDDPFVRQAIDSLVRSLGYRASTFASAEDFLQSSNIHEMTCLISDVQMPGLSGVDLQRVLIAQGNRMPMIFITAYFDEGIRQSVMEAGAIGYLGKPFDDESLIELLQLALRRGRRSQVDGGRGSVEASSAIKTMGVSISASGDAMPRSATA